ncbi:hypothetical protein AgCh_025738 [Apium graveolens]
MNNTKLIARERFDVKCAVELARAIKDYPRRKKEKGWESFDYKSPKDCLTFMYYRLALEHQSLEVREAGLFKALVKALVFQEQRSRTKWFKEERHTRMNKKIRSDGGCVCVRNFM